KNKSVRASLFGTQEQRKRFLKEIYIKFPLFLRPLTYFFWRYIIKLGFLDGKPGLIWHFLQGFWYRFLIDSIVYDLTSNTDVENIEKLKKNLIEKYRLK
ncbi:TPA: glycosyltransferase family 2 protein, partial [Escherichia coli]